MKIKSISAALFFLSAITCLTACGNGDSSEKPGLETQIIEAGPDIGSTIETKALPVTDDKSQKLAEISGSYDRDKPEETVLAILKSTVPSDFKSRTDYNEETSTYTLEIWCDGFEDNLKSEQGKSVLIGFRNNFEVMWKQNTEQIRTEIDPDANIRFSLISDKDLKTPLLTIENGTAIYDISIE